ncbi:MAG: hypothetical protein IPK44_03290 [Candidatus Accumulibacter sp.]|uniref:hypothetical protein n=1 Tax=Accumulibacter sp. TaxID=2053492 RepID=UPI00338FFF12|nr:hypothetical protein [Accumulibacter sp.]
MTTSHTGIVPWANPLGVVEVIFDRPPLGEFAEIAPRRHPHQLPARVDLVPLTPDLGGAVRLHYLGDVMPTVERPTGG